MRLNAPQDGALRPIPVGTRRMRRALRPSPGAAEWRRPEGPPGRARPRVPNPDPPPLPSVLSAPCCRGCVSVRPAAPAGTAHTLPGGHRTPQPPPSAGTPARPRPLVRTPTRPGTSPPPLPDPRTTLTCECAPPQTHPPTRARAPAPPPSPALCPPPPGSALSSVFSAQSAALGPGRPRGLCQRAASQGRGAHRGGAGCGERGLRSPDGGWLAWLGVTVRS